MNSAVSRPDRLDDAPHSIIHTRFPAASLHALMCERAWIMRFVQGGAQMCPTDVDCNDLAHADDYTVPHAAMPLRGRARRCNIMGSR